MPLGELPSDIGQSPEELELSSLLSRVNIPFHSIESSGSSHRIFVRNHLRNLWDQREIKRDYDVALADHADDADFYLSAVSMGI